MFRLSKEEAEKLQNQIKANKTNRWGGKSRNNESLDIPPKSSKYRAKKANYNGINYDSQKEALRASELDILLRTNQIEYWTRQVPFYLGCMENKYVVDFLVIHNDQTIHVEDVKGYETPAFKKNKKLWERYGPCELHILKRSGKKWIVEII